MAELEKESEPDPRLIQINLTGFLERNTGAFMAELWKLLISAQENCKVCSVHPVSCVRSVLTLCLYQEEKGKIIKGMPQQLLDEKQEELKRINSELQAASS